MATLEERVSKLEANIARLETWAGPGQIEALIEGQRDLRRQMGDLRTQMGDVRTDVAALKTDVAALKTDVAALKTDMAWVKETLQEVLRRLPPPPPA